MCYTGVVGSGLTMNPRFWNGGNPIYQRGTTIEARSSSYYGMFRPFVQGAGFNMHFSSLYGDYGAGAEPTDPYLPAGETHHIISIFSSGSVGDAQDVVVQRTKMSNGMEIRRLGTSSPFTNGLMIQNVFNVSNQNFPIPQLTPASPSSSIACFPGTWVAFDGTYLYPCATDGHPRRFSIGTTF